MVELPVPILVAVRGQCLGGGLEVALAGSLIFAAPDAQFGQPEMKLGVFAPAASVLLPYRIGPGRGRRPAVLRPLDRRRRSEGAAAWCTRSPTTPTAAALACFDEHLAGKSAAALALRASPLRAAPMLARRAAPPGRSRAPLPGPPDGDARRQRRPRRLPRQAQAATGSTADGDDHEPRVIEIVERCEALFEDLHFNAVKEWKAAAPGRKAIGYMPVYVPREMIHAAGMLPVGILGGGDQLEVIQGDAYYQSYICRIPRSTLELGLTGRLDCLDGMLFPSICDVIRNLSGMWQILFKDKYVRYVDVPQNYQDEIGGKFYIHEMQLLRDDLGQAARQADHRRRAERVDRRLQRQPPRGPRALRLPRQQALAGADLRGLPAAARRHGAAGRGAHGAGARVPRRGGRRCRGPSATTRAS